MDPRSVIFEVHKAFERELRTVIVGEWAVLARLKPMMPVKVALQRMFATEGVLAFEQGQCSVTDAMQTLERSTLEWELASDQCLGIRVFRFDIHVGVVIRGACRSIILPRSTGFPRTPFLTSTQRDQVVDDGDLPI